MPEQTLDEVLAHYGILGMKWGVRRSDKQLARSRFKRKKAGKPVTPVSEDVKKARAAKAKISPEGDVSALSNHELQSVLHRMRLEQQYDQITGGNKKTTRGQKVTQKIVKAQKTINQVNNFAKSPAGKMVAKALRDSLIIDFEGIKL